MIFGITAPFSPFVLILAAIIIYFSVFIQRENITSNLLKMLLLFYILSLLIGYCVFLFDPSYVHFKISHLSITRIYVSSIILITAVYLGAKNLIFDKGINYLLGFIYISTLIPIFIIATGPLLGINNLYNFASGNTLTQTRATGLFANPNEAGAFASYFLVICLCCYSHFKKYYIIFLLSVPLALYVSFLTLSRTSIILSTALLILYVVYNLKFTASLKSSNILKVSIFSIITLSATVFAADKFFEYVGDMTYAQRMRLMETFQLLSGEINEKTTSERSHLYTFAFEEIKKRPILGHGLGAFRRMVNLPSPRKLGVHNTHLLIWGETGIIPFLLFIIFFIFLGLKAMKHKSAMAGFFILGVISVYFLGICGTGHNGLENRSSNVLIAIAIIFSQYKFNSSNTT